MTKLAKELGSDYCIVSDSQDREYLVQYEGVDDYPTYLVKVSDGEITEIWGSPSFVVYENTILYRLK